MKKTTTLKLLGTMLGFGLLTAQAATYNGDLIIGFTAETGNDLEYDLGSAATLTDGQTWNLSSLLSSFDLNTVKWGVIGDTTTGNPKNVWATKATGTPAPLNGNAAWSTVNAPTVAMYGLFPTAGAGQNIAPSSTLANSWNQQTIASSVITTYKNAYMNPNITGLAASSFWKTVTDNSAPTLIGTFSLAANGVVTFHTVSTAPPAPALTITRVGNLNSISFMSANAATYTLSFTNSQGLTVPTSTWPTQVGTITGNGTLKTFTDTTTDANRFYRVKAQ